MSKLRVLDLFSGIGGFSLGLERTGGFETVAFCEIEPFCQKVLKKHWPEIEIYNDVRTLPKFGSIDVVCGGYPCQPFSTAGKRRGDQDDRHLWPAMFAVIKAERPSWVIGENVAGHVSMGLDEVLFDLESEGYTARPYIIPACATDAPHRRDRIWIIASIDDANSDRQRPHRTAIDKQRGGEPIDGEVGQPGQVCEVLARSGDAGKREAQLVGDTASEQCRKARTDSGRSKEWIASASSSSGDVADTETDIARGLSIGAPAQKSRPSRNGQNVSYPSSQRQPGQGQPFKSERPAQDKNWQTDKPFSISQPRIWPTEPNVGRVANGVPQRVDRLKSLGNSVVPDIPERIGHAILEAEAA